MKKLIILILFLSSSIAFATAQAPDTLFYNGKKEKISSNPLESYFEKIGKHPNFNEETVIINGKEEIVTTTSTGCWRGYFATWSIENDYLYLIKIENLNHKIVDLKKLFNKDESKIKANWYTGILRIKNGKLLRYVHMGYRSVFEKEILIHVESGRVKKVEHIDNSKKKIPSAQELEIQEIEKMRSN